MQHDAFTFRNRNHRYGPYPGAMFGAKQQPSNDGQDGTNPDGATGTLRMAWAWLHNLRNRQTDLEERVAYIEDQTGVRLYDDKPQVEEVKHNPSA